MSNRIVLVYPAVPGDKQKPNRPPLGLLTIAAVVLNKGIEVRLLDERVLDDFDFQLCEELKRGPMCVGISSMSGSHIKGGLRVSRLVKSRSKVPVVWGGVHPSLEPETTLRHELVDFIVRDDGEESFSELLLRLRNAPDQLDSIRGIGFKKDNNLVITEPAAPFPLEKLPLVPYGLVDFNDYRAPLWLFDLQLPMETSRGCPYSCTFCTESVRKKKWRALSPERVISDIKQYIKKYQIRDLSFIDDNFFGDAKRGNKILDLLIEEKLDIRWYINLRLDFVARSGPAFIKRLKTSGCKVVTFGTESGSRRILEMVNKKTRLEYATEVNHYLKDTQIYSHFVLIHGFPTEEPNDFKKSLLLAIRILLENKNAFCDIPFLIPTPGTVMAKQCWRKDMDSFSLEEHSNFFDFGIHKRPPFIKRPPWVLKETFNCILRYSIVLWLINKTNRSGMRSWRNHLYYFLLKIIRVIIGSGLP